MQDELFACKPPDVPCYLGCQGPVTDHMEKTVVCPEGDDAVTLGKTRADALN